MRIFERSDGRTVYSGNGWEYDRIANMMMLDLKGDSSLTVDEGIHAKWGFFSRRYVGILRPKTQEELDKDFEKELFEFTMGAFSLSYRELAASYKANRIRYYGDRLWKLFDEDTVMKLKYPREYVK